MIAILAALLLQAPAQGAPRVQVGIVVRPDTVTVGDPFVVAVEIRAPAGARVEFPVGPDSASAIQALDPRTVRSTPAAGSLTQIATYRMVAWDIGDRPLGLSDATVIIGGVRTAVPITGTLVHVRSVLPADTTLRVPKPARPPFDMPLPWWRFWWVLALLALAALLFWLWWRRRRRGTPDESNVDAFAYAEREFARVEAMGLLEAGERGRFVALMVEVLRDYLARGVEGALPSLTSTELLQAVRSKREVPIDRLAPVLSESDMIKCARRPVTTERAREIAGQARAIARDVETARRGSATSAAAAPRENAA
jgi:hypothetical protein